MIEEKAVEMLHQFESLAKQYTPDVIDAAISVTRIDGLASIIVGLLLLLCIWPLYVGGFRGYKFFDKKRKEDLYGDWELGIAATLISVPSVVILLAIFGLCLVLDVWNWVAIFEPKLYIAKQIMSL